MIKVLFFAQLKELLQCSQIELSINAPCDVDSLKQQIVNEHPNWQAHLNQNKVLAAVNQTMVDATHLINDGDEVAFFPPVTGG
ncbi:MAG: molybdopterin synthase sulfur carrier subunit [Gammaproteobacteria bacterium]|nr:molybdopterin synthase sulfur carrier subunit [Gammaproteobacteria bacterium]